MNILIKKNCDPITSVLKGEQTKRIYFSGLNEIRAIAALMVFIHHVEQYKYDAKEPSLWENHLIHAFGPTGVNLFFVLSGFLITILLLHERKKTGTLNFKIFYLKRVLRIWPLYYLVFLASILLFPWISKLDFFQLEIQANQMVDTINYSGIVPLYIFFLSNAALALFPPLLGASQSWSVSVEEQFYLFWPVLIWVARRRLMLVLVIFLASKLILNKLLWLYVQNSDSHTAEAVLNIFTSMKFELMAVGGIGACLFFRHQSFIETNLKNKTFPLFALILGGMGIYLEWHYLLVGVIFLVLILTFITNKVHNKVFDFLGKISYGIYMYQYFAIYLAFAVLHNMVIENATPIYNVCAYVISFVLLLAISYLSFKYIETPFLSIKNRFSLSKGIKI